MIIQIISAKISDVASFSYVQKVAQNLHIKVLAQIITVQYEATLTRDLNS